MAHILVVDDESVIREILVTLLEMQGHEVTEAGSGAEALATFDEDTHDLVISDIMMPEMNGFDLLRSLQPRWQPWSARPGRPRRQSAGR